MSHPLSNFAAARYGHLASTSGTATVPAGAFVTSFSAISTAGGTIVITPRGPNTVSPASALPTITIPAGASFESPLLSQLGNLGPGTTIAFSGTDSYYVSIAYGSP